MRSVTKYWIVALIIGVVLMTFTQIANEPDLKYFGGISIGISFGILFGDKLKQKEMEYCVECNKETGVLIIVYGKDCQQRSICKTCFNLQNSKTVEVERN